MEYWQKFSFITSSSKGLIGYSLRYSGEREAAVCMSGIVGGVEGVQGRSAGVEEERRTRQTGEYIKDKRQEEETLHLVQNPKSLTGDWVQGSNVLLDDNLKRMIVPFNKKIISQVIKKKNPDASEIPPMKLIREHNVSADNVR